MQHLLLHCSRISMNHVSRVVDWRWLVRRAYSNIKCSWYIRWWRRIFRIYERTLIPWAEKNADCLRRGDVSQYSSVRVAGEGCWIILRVYSNVRSVKKFSTSDANQLRTVIGTVLRFNCPSRMSYYDSLFNLLEIPTIKLESLRACFQKRSHFSPAYSEVESKVLAGLAPQCVNSL